MRIAVLTCAAPLPTAALCPDARRAYFIPLKGAGIILIHFEGMEDLFQVGIQGAVNLEGLRGKNTWRKYHPDIDVRQGVLHIDREPLQDGKTLVLLRTEKRDEAGREGLSCQSSLDLPEGRILIS